MFAFLILVTNYFESKEFVLNRLLKFILLSASGISFIFIVLHVGALKTTGVGQLNAETINVKQSKILISKIEKNKILDKIKTTLIENFKIIEIGNNHLRLSSKISGKSWGEIVNINIIDNNDSVIKVHVSSKPKLFFTLVDFGKNKDNVDLIEKILS